MTILAWKETYQSLTDSSLFRKANSKDDQAYLRVKTIATGEKVLEIARLNLIERAISWLGLGNASLRAVNDFLCSEEGQSQLKNIFNPDSEGTPLSPLQVRANLETLEAKSLRALFTLKKIFHVQSLVFGSNQQTGTKTPFEAILEIPDILTHKIILPHLPLHSLGRLQTLSKTIRSAIQSNSSQVAATIIQNRALELPTKQLLELAFKAGRDLSSLDLSDRYDLTNEDLTRIVNACPNLQMINLRNCSKINDAGLASLANLSKLEELNLNYIHITDNGLVPLANLTGLKRLSIAHYGREITEGGLTAFLSGLTNLQELNLKNVPLTDKVLNCVATLNNLQQLMLISPLQRSMQNPLCRNQGLAFLTTLTNLKQLKIPGWSQITDDDLAFLVNLTNLRHLNISLCNQITDTGLIHLTKLTDLKQIDIQHCDLITNKGKRTLKEASPDCRVS